MALTRRAMAAVASTRRAMRRPVASTCKGCANYLKPKEIREMAERPALVWRFDLKRRFNYVKLKRISMVTT
jgi:hypothetical protein